MSSSLISKKEFHSRIGEPFEEEDEFNQATACESESHVEVVEQATAQEIPAEE